MAYISKEEVKVIRNGIKSVFPSKEGYKFSIRGRDSSSIDIVLVKSPTNHPEVKNHQLNDIYPDIYEGDTRLLVETLNDILQYSKPCVNRNAGDYGADYCNYTYYKNYNIGDWEKDFVHVEGKTVNWNEIKERVTKFKIRTQLNKLIE